MCVNKADSNVMINDKHKQKVNVCILTPSVTISYLSDWRSQLTISNACSLLCKLNADLLLISVKLASKLYFKNSVFINENKTQLSLILFSLYKRSIVIKISFLF
jgi:hypothetical protein